MQGERNKNVLLNSSVTAYLLKCSIPRIQKSRFDIA